MQDEPIIEQASQVEPTSTSTQPMDKAEWVKRYWFTPYQMVTVINPLSYDWPFMVEMRHFIIKAGAIESFPGPVANVYLDQMSKIQAQNDDKLGFMADPALKKIYYDDLIVSVESLVKEQDTTPEYLKNIPERVKTEAPSERPPWEAPIELESAKLPRLSPTEVSELKEMNSESSTKAENKEFEFEGNKYKLVVAKNGKHMYYKNGQMTSEAEYSRAASLI